MGNLFVPPPYLDEIAAGLGHFSYDDLARRARDFSLSCPTVENPDQARAAFSMFNRAVLGETIKDVYGRHGGFNLVRSPGEYHEGPFKVVVSDEGRIRVQNHQGIFLEIKNHAVHDGVFSWFDISYNKSRNKGLKAHERPLYFSNLAEKLRMVFPEPHAIGYIHLGKDDGAIDRSFFQLAREAGAGVTFPEFDVSSVIRALCENCDGMAPNLGPLERFVGAHPVKVYAVPAALDPSATIDVAFSSPSIDLASSSPSAGLAVPSISIDPSPPLDAPAPIDPATGLARGGQDQEGSGMSSVDGASAIVHATRIEIISPPPAWTPRQAYPPQMHPPRRRMFQEPPFLDDIKRFLEHLTAGDVAPQARAFAFANPKVLQSYHARQLYGNFLEQLLSFAVHEVYRDHGESRYLYTPGEYHKADLSLKINFFGGIEVRNAKGNYFEIDTHAVFRDVFCAFEITHHQQKNKRLCNAEEREHYFANLSRKFTDCFPQPHALAYFYVRRNEGIHEKNVFRIARQVGAGVAYPSMDTSMILDILIKELPDVGLNLHQLRQFLTPGMQETYASGLAQESPAGLGVRSGGGIVMESRGMIISESVPEKSIVVNIAQEGERAAISSSPRDPDPILRLPSGMKSVEIEGIPASPSSDEVPCLEPSPASENGVPSLLPDFGRKDQ